MLDYCVVSGHIAPYIESCTLDSAAPWTPHAGIKVVIKARPAQVRAMRLVRPLRVTALWGTTQTAKGKEKQERKTVTEASWKDRAWVQSAVEVEIPREVQQTPAYIVDPGGARFWEIV